MSDIKPAGQLSQAVLQETAGVFAMLSAPIRVQILLLLGLGGRDVGTLASETGETMATVSHHLGKLKLAGLVNVQRHGRRRVYVATDSEVIDVVRAIIASRQHLPQARIASGHD